MAAHQKHTYLGFSHREKSDSNGNHSKHIWVCLFSCFKPFLPFAQFLKVASTSKEEIIRIMFSRLFKDSESKDYLCFTKVHKCIRKICHLCWESGLINDLKVWELKCVDDKKILIFKRIAQRRMYLNRILTNDASSEKQHHHQQSEYLKGKNAFSWEDLDTWWGRSDGFCKYFCMTEAHL